MKRLRRRTLKKTYNEESERSNGGPNSQPTHLSVHQAIDVDSSDQDEKAQNDDDESSYSVEKRAKKSKESKKKKQKKADAGSLDFSDASEIEDHVSLDSIE